MLKDKSFKPVHLQVSYEVIAITEMIADTYFRPNSVFKGMRFDRLS